MCLPMRAFVGRRAPRTIAVHVFPEIFVLAVQRAMVLRANVGWYIMFRT